MHIGVRLSVLLGLSAGCTAKESVTCGKNTFLKGSTCVPVVDSGVADIDLNDSAEPSATDSGSADTDSGSSDTGTPVVYAPEVLFHGTVVSALQQDTIVTSGCVQIWSHHPVFVLDSAELIASVAIDEDGRWSTTITTPEQDLPPLIQVVDCEGAYRNLYPTATWVTAKQMQEWKRTGEAELVRTMSFTEDDIDEIDAALSEIGFFGGFRSWGGLFGTIKDAVGDVVVGARVDCVDGDCPDYYPAGAWGRSLFQDESSVVHQSTGSNGHFAIPSGTINTYFAAKEGLGFDSITAGTIGPTVIYVDFEATTD
jgi:hypothetical protein